MSRQRAMPTAGLAVDPGYTFRPRSHIFVVDARYPSNQRPPVVSSRARAANDGRQDREKRESQRNSRFIG